MSEKSNHKGLLKGILNKGKSLEAEMSFFDHLNVLRKHLVRAVLVIIFLTCLAFYYYDFLFDVVIMGPKNPNFWTYRMLCKLVEIFPSIGADMCIKSIPGEIINTQMAGQFNLQLTSCFTAGVVMGVPYLLWEIWRFVKPALHEDERRSASGFVFFASALFIIGILFGYYIVSPLSVNFLANYTVSDIIKNTFTIDSYLSSVATLTLGTGIIFQLPVVVYILSKLGLMTPQFMRSSRRYAVIIILVVAAIVTPTPDLITMLTVAAPLFLLYEFSIFISSSIHNKRLKAEKALSRTY